MTRDWTEDETKWMFLNSDNLSVHTGKPSEEQSYVGNIETFIPSDATLKEGYLVYAAYVNYDSINCDEDYSFMVVDLYADKDKAVEAAKVIQQKFGYGSRIDHTEETKDALIVFDHGGDPVKHFPFAHWGSRFEWCAVYYVEVDKGFRMVFR